MNLIIFGASARAAAFSALRAGLQPWCADLFGDRDLQARCPVICIPPRHYPEAFRELITREIRGPWMYTGGLENRPGLVDDLARVRRLWGNQGRALRQSRAPSWAAGHLRKQGLPAPAVWCASVDHFPTKGRWLIKPLAGAGGTGIRFWTPGDPPPQPRREYLQEFIEGQPCAAIYVGNGHGCWLVGVTQQLIGETWLGAAPFHYCGSIGPMLVTPALLQAFGCLGSLLTEGFGIRGLFGVDCVVRDGYPYPVEVNPRYTASIEVLEYASGSAVLDRHCFMFEPELPEAPPGPVAAPVIGKAILFARDSLTFPADGPWMATLRQPGNIWELPDFADIPAAGTPIPAGRPILTFFVRGDSVNACQDALQQRAAELNRWLFP